MDENGKLDMVSGDFEILSRHCARILTERNGAFSGRLTGILRTATVSGFSGAFAPDRETRFRLRQRHRACIGEMAGGGAGNGFPKGQVFYQERKYRIGEWITCPQKEIAVDVVLGNRTGLPCIYAEGEIICSGKTGLFRTS